VSLDDGGLGGVGFTGEVTFGHGLAVGVPSVQLSWHPLATRQLEKLIARHSAGRVDPPTMCYQNHNI
jgi:hypothetical protein